MRRNTNAAYRELATSQKASAGAPLYSLVINRPLGRIFAAGGYALGLTPNQVTAISAGFTMSAIILLAAGQPTLLTALLVTLGLVIGYALDSADGQLARLRGGGSLTGEWLDHFIDSIKMSTIHLAVLIMAFRYFDVPTWWLLVPLVFSAASVVHFFGMLLTDLLARTRGSSGPRQPGSSLMAAAKLPTDYGILCLSFILLPTGMVFVVVYTLLAAAMAGYTALVSMVWYRRMSKVDAS